MNECLTVSQGSGKGGAPILEGSANRKRRHGAVFESFDPSQSLRTKNDRRSPTTAFDAGRTQSAFYAREFMATTHGSRAHCLGHLLQDGELTPLYYDASGAVYASESISMIHDFPKFAAFVIAMASLTP